jgi:hypothetical protein
MNLEEIDRYGQPWFVCQDLNAAKTDEIVRPTPLRRDPQGIQGDRLSNKVHLIVRGFAFTVVSAGAGNGFYLKSRGTDNQERIHFRYISGAAGAVCLAVTPCFIPIAIAELTSPVTDPYSLFIETVGTCTLGSCVSIWGLHTTMDFGRQGYTGSPVVFPA